jgi:predicted enzyme related to lactoylglutathione lyase
MKIKLASVLVDDQEKAVKFYTEKLGFIVKTDIPMGHSRWITLVSAEDQDGSEISLEPDMNPVLEGKAIEFKQKMKESKIPWTAYESNNLENDYEKMKNSGVDFISPPAETGPVKSAILDDTCGNLIMIYQPL